MSQESNANQQYYVVESIESMIQNMLKVIDTRDGHLEILLRAPSTSRRDRFFNYVTDAIEVRERNSYRILAFPGNGREDALRFTIFLRVLDLIHEALVTGVVTTKRDIYYKDPELFHNQVTVDRCVDDIAFHFDVSRSTLNVRAAAKGLVAGCFRIVWTTGNETIVEEEANGLLVPQIEDISFLNLVGIDWIMVVEKEATFRTLVSRKFHLKGPRNGILLTRTGPAPFKAKGYPDISTRAFLRYLSEQRHTSSFSEFLPPIYMLVDNDPHGIAIMSTYKYGSAALSHENATLVTPRILWLGVKTSDITTHDDLEGGLEKGLIPLTSRDRRKAVNMLDSPVFAQDGPEPEWRREVQLMLMLNWKAEIQMFGEGPETLVRFLEEKMRRMKDDDDEMLLN